MVNPFASLAADLAREEVDDSSLSAIFDEEPVDLDTFIRDKKFLGQTNVFLSHEQEMAIRVIERVYYPELYPLMGEEFNSDYWRKDIPMRNLITLQWGKGSTDPDTPIYDARTGLWKPLRDFKAGPVASAMYTDGQVFTAHGTDAFHEGDGRMFIVKTKMGRKIRVWEGHRFLGWGRECWGKGGKVNFAQSGKPEWKRLWDYKVGDHIAVSSFVPEPEETVEFLDRDVEMLGLFIGDGSLGREWSFELVCGVDATITRQRIRELASLYDDTEIQETLDISGGSSRWHLKPVNIGTRSHSKAFRDVASKWSISGHKASTKHVPEEFFRADNRQIALLVSRLIDTDGWVSISNTVEVGYGTISERLADDVVNLMLRLGVAATKQTKTSKYRGEPYTSYQVRVRDRVSARRLLEQLTLLDKEPKRVAALEWLNSTGNGKVHARHGDLVWDTITSIEYDGWGEYWTLSVDGPAAYISNGGVFDHNSGKDAVSRWASLRVAYLLLCLKSPQEYFGMPDSDSIHLLNIAANAPQAKQAFFDPMSKAVKRGWFRDKAAPKQGLIEYDKNVTAISGHSDAEGQEGLNIMLGVADEIDAFKAKDEMVGQGKRAREASTSAESILKMLKGSASTRFPKTYKRVAISYPRYLGSTIQRLTAEGKASNERYGEKSIHFVSGPFATWEINPRISGPEDFAEDYDSDPIEAASMYECKPSRAVDPFYKNMSIFRNSVDRDAQPLTIDYVLRDVRSEQTGEVTQGWEPVFHFSEGFAPIQGARYALHGDLAIKGDRAGIAMSHVERWEEVNVQNLDAEGVPQTSTEIRPIIRNDFTIAFSADATAKDHNGVSLPREIQIRWVRMLAFELIQRGFLIASFTFDSYQSQDTIQTFTAHGIESGKVSTDRDPSIWRAVKDVASEGRLRMPYEQLLLNELEGLSNVGGGKVDHLAGGSKDLADAFACSIIGAIAAGGEEDPNGSIVDIGEPVYNVGGALSSLEGDDMVYGAVGDPLGLPIGFSDRGMYGW